MQPTIITIPPKKFIGQRIRTFLADNRTYELWRGFMPLRGQIQNVLNTDLYSIDVFDGLSYFAQFSPQNTFEKWAAVEVVDLDAVPAGMETLTVSGGLYAVFVHRGPASAGANTYRYILTEWLPQSGYVLDDRPHFAVMGAKYKNNDPESEEDIWVPVKVD